jgi:hypothetical protein
VKYLGNLLEDQTVDFKFNTHQASGTPITLAGTPAVSVYKANGTTETTAGVTLTVDFDSRTGCHHVRIDTSADAFYAAASDYQVVLTAGTVDGTSVVGTVLAEFSIENRFKEVDVTFWNGSAVVPPTNLGVPVVDVTHWRNDAVPVTSVAGIPEVDVTHWLGTAPAAPTTAGVPKVDVSLWTGGTVASPNVTGVPKVDITHTLGVAVTNEDFTIASATASTVTVPTADSASVSIPDDDRYAWHELHVTGGTGKGQVVRLGAGAAGARTYDVISGTMPVQLDSTSKVVDLGDWSANTTHAAGTAWGSGAVTAASLAADAANEIADAVHACTILTGTVESTGTTPTNIVLKTMDPTLTVTNQLKGRVILFKKTTTTAALRGQGAPIDGSTTTAITLAAGDALTTTPAEDDSFVIV